MSCKGQPITIMSTAYGGPCMLAQAHACWPKSPHRMHIGWGPPPAGCVATSPNCNYNARATAAAYSLRLLY